jgi:hypothetical protein
MSAALMLPFEESALLLSMALLPPPDFEHAASASRLTISSFFMVISTRKSGFEGEAFFHQPADALREVWRVLLLLSPILDAVGPFGFDADLEKTGLLHSHSNGLSTQTLGGRRTTSVAR